MSLLDDRKKAVELFIENLYTGSITSEMFDIGKVGWQDDSGTANEYNSRTEMFNSIMPDIEKWVKLRSAKTDNEEFSTITKSLFNRFLRARTAGFFRGSFKEIASLEAELKKCKADNKQLAKELMIYKSKEGTPKQDFRATT